MSGPPALPLHPAFLDDPALRAVLAALPRARIVGGAVRDAILGRPVSDIDLATPYPPEAVIAALRAAGLKAVPTGIAHGTVTAVSAGRGFEITTLRRDVETDGRHATVAFDAGWRDDAARRDFTINAMSMTPDGHVFDYFGGIEDARAGRVRFVGDAATRLAEDYLRLLRYFRFHARYADAPPDPNTRAALAAAVPGLARLSPERVWAELKRLLQAPDPGASVALMAELGVLAAVLPEGADPAALAALLRRPAPADPLLRLAALLPPGADAARVAERLRLANAERDRLAALRAEPALPENATDDDLRRALAATPAAILCDRIRLARHDPALIGRLEAMPRPAFPLAGKDATALGIPPGPRIGALLREVEAWWLARGCTPGPDACRAELARLAALAGPVGTARLSRSRGDDRGDEAARDQD
jgi:poly(A) polymerase/tRNA nucleotidyltransferase (CCA-adding enzyme)